tara:strand:- start:150 stop:1139 length:990 start_codon:yes stop_codon:yes gene_type:complete
MKVQNETKNQHFVSQVEQRLNSSNPNSPNKSQNIYSFKIIDREIYSIELESKNSKSIANNLSWYDLFSFDVESKQIRSNFEALFGEYEEKTEINTLNLLQKLEENNNDIKEELLSLFVLKLLNTFRNPYCIKKTLNTIGQASIHQPLDSSLAKIFLKVKQGNKPQQQWLCSQLGITPEEYGSWLKTLFILLMRPDENKPNILEQMVKSMYENDSSVINVFVFYYDEELIERSVLLSDRGFSTPVQSDEVLAYNFNLSSRAFITFAFSNVNQSAPEATPQRIIDAYKHMRNNVSVKMFKNNLDALTVYNKHTVYQSFERVYCSNKVIYGL